VAVEVYATKRLQLRRCVPRTHEAALEVYATKRLQLQRCAPRNHEVSVEVCHEAAGPRSAKLWQGALGPNFRVTLFNYMNKNTFPHK